MTTNNLVRLEDVLEIIKENMSWDRTSELVQELKTYPEPTKGSNHNLLQEYIDGLNTTDMVDAYSMLRAIQSRLTEGTEYKFDEKYEFSDDGKSWMIRELSGFLGSIPNGNGSSISYRNIRPISPISPELADAIALVEASGYTLNKK